MRYSKRKMIFPVILTVIVILVIVYLFANIKQSTITCNKVKKFDSDIKVEEDVIIITDGKVIDEMNITKSIFLPNNHNNSDCVNGVKNALHRTLDYLDKNVAYTYSDNKIIINIKVKKNEIVLLDNISFDNNGDISINSNTKSDSVVALKIGDSYSDSELMTWLKSKGYSCK